MNIRTVAVIGVPGTMGANVAGILPLAAMQKFTVMDATLNSKENKSPHCEIC